MCCCGRRIWRKWPPLFAASAAGTKSHRASERAAHRDHLRNVVHFNPRHIIKTQLFNNVSKHRLPYCWPPYGVHTPDPCNLLPPALPPACPPPRAATELRRGAPALPPSTASKRAQPPTADSSPLASSPLRRYSRARK